MIISEIKFKKMNEMKFKKIYEMKFKKKINEMKLK